MAGMPIPPESTKASLQYRLCEHARDRWPNLDLDVRHRAGFAYVDARLANSEVVPLLRLRYGYLRFSRHRRLSRGALKALMYSAKSPTPDDSLHLPT